MRCLIVAGRHRFDLPGATHVVLNNLLAAFLPHSSCTVVGLAGRGEGSGEPVWDAVRHENIHSVYLRRTAHVRALAKVSRILPSRGSTIRARNWVASCLAEIADEISAEVIDSALERDQSPAVVAGLGSLSGRSGAVAKEHDAKYVLHSQWAHPKIQESLVQAAHEEVGLRGPVFPKSKREKQVREFAQADVIWCPSEFVRDSLVKCGVEAQRTIVVHPGIRIADYAVGRTRARQGSDRLIILFVGRVCIEKGIHVLLDALEHSSLRGAQLVLNGSADADALELISRAEATLRTRDISIELDPGDPRRHLGRASLFVLPSVHDAFGLVVLEAMAAGLPVVVSSSVGARECIAEGENGLIFESGSARHLAETLDRLDADRTLLCRFGGASKALVEDYDVNVVAPRLFRAIGRALAQRPGE